MKYPIHSIISVCLQINMCIYENQALPFKERLG